MSNLIFEVGEDVKAVLFDLGGVIINIDYDATVSAFAALGVPQFESQFSQELLADFFAKFEIGEVSEADFYNYVRENLSMNLSNEQITLAWNKMLLDIPPKRVELLKLLSEKYKTYLLSNTNIVHLKAFDSQFKLQFGSSVRDLFIKAYFSHEIGKRKPNVNAFNFVLEDANLIASETLFIDDTLMNILGAQKAGLRVHYLQKGNDILNINWNL